MRTILFALLFLAACTTPAVPPLNDTQAPASFSYADGVLTWQAEVEKPTPCHEVIVDEQITNGNVVIDLTVGPPADEQICAQVIDTETVRGTIELDSAPDNVEIRIDERGIVPGPVQ